MTDFERKADLQRYLQTAREALLWKLEGLDEYDARRPLTPTGTNLLGLVKHAAGVEVGYFGDCFQRPFDQVLPWLQDDAEPNADMWATAEESREDVVDLYRRVWRHSDATITALALDAAGRVPWWPMERREVTLHRVLVHVVADTDRHAGASRQPTATPSPTSARVPAGSRCTAFQVRARARTASSRSTAVSV